MTAAEYRKWAKKDRESAELYAKWAADAERDARFWFNARNTGGDVNSTEEFGKTGKTAYEFYRGKFLAARKSLKGWRRLATKMLLQSAAWTEKARVRAISEKAERNTKAGA